MEQVIRKIIQEELRRALLEITQPFLVTQDEEEIIYSFERGRSFGINNLAHDINGLRLYYMNDYFPHSESEEGWMFEIDMTYGGNQLIEITHQNRNGNSQWKLSISDVDKNTNIPTVTSSTKFIIGYKSFIELVNSKFENKINPEFL